VTPDSAPESEEPQAGFAEIALCPIDRDTHLVRTSYEILVNRETSEAEFVDLSIGADDARLSPQDRAKLHALVAIGALRCGRSDLANQHLEVLVHDGVFGPWAARALEGVSDLG
jgi:hypothetical protein